MKTDRHNRRAGFTLIEVLVAFTILGLASGAIMSVFGFQPTKIARAENERLAVLCAQSELARVGNDIPIATGEQEGATEGVTGHWSISIRPYEGVVSHDQAATGAVLPTKPYWVTVQATIGEGLGQASATLSSLRLKVSGP